MAEYVEQSIEEMQGELEEMINLGLFNESERQTILKKRKAFEYKLRRRIKEKTDYLHYIQYEIQLLALIIERRKRKGTRCKEIEIAVVKRIQKLFQLATVRFKNDITLWLSYIEFLKSRKEKSSVTRIFSEMLRINTHNEKLWVMAANWEFMDCNNPASARKIYLKGLRFNPESQLLWKEYYRQELSYLAKIQRLKTDNSEILHEEISCAVLSGEVARAVYTNAIATIKGDVLFIKSILSVAENFSFALDQQEDLISHLREHYSDSEETWDILARRTARVKLDSFEKSVEVYRESLERIPTELMWSKFITFVREDLEKCVDDVRKSKLSYLLSLYKEAAILKCLSRDLHIDWIDCLNQEQFHKEALQSSSQILENSPQDVALWCQHLLLLTNNSDCEADLLTRFRKSLSLITTKKSWPVWKIILDFLSTNNSPQLKSHLEECSGAMVPHVCLPAKLFYLNWSMEHEDVRSTQLLYHKLKSCGSTSLDFFALYLEFAKQTVKTNISDLRRIHEDIVLNFGSSNADVWLDYIDTEQTYPDGDVTASSRLYTRALQSLADDEASRFCTEFALKQVGCKS